MCFFRHNASLEVLGRPRGPGDSTGCNGPKGWRPHKRRQLRRLHELRRPSGLRHPAAPLVAVVPRRLRRAPCVVILAWSSSTGGRDPLALARPTTPSLSHLRRHLCARAVAPGLARASLRPRSTERGAKLMESWGVISYEAALLDALVAFRRVRPSGCSNVVTIRRVPFGSGGRAGGRICGAIGRSAACWGRRSADRAASPSVG